MRGERVWVTHMGPHWGGAGYSGGGGGKGGQGNGGKDGGDGCCGEAGGEGSSFDLSTTTLDTFTLTPGKGGEQYTTAGGGSGGGGGGVMVDGQGPTRPNYEGQGYGGGGGFGEGNPGVVLMEIKLV